MNDTKLADLAVSILSQLPTPKVEAFSAARRRGAARAAVAGRGLHPRRRAAAAGARPARPAGAHERDQRRRLRHLADRGRNPAPDGVDDQRAAAGAGRAASRERAHHAARRRRGAGADARAGRTQDRGGRGVRRAPGRPVADRRRLHHRPQLPHRRLLRDDGDHPRTAAAPSGAGAADLPVALRPPAGGLRDPADRRRRSPPHLGADRPRRRTPAPSTSASAARPDPPAGILPRRCHRTPHWRTRSTRSWPTPAPPSPCPGTSARPASPTGC